MLAASLAGGCAALSNDGGGGLDETARRAQLDEARAVSTAAATPGASPEASRVLDLATALELAQRNNRSIAAARASVDAAAGQVGVARGALLPTHQVRGQWQWFSDEQANSVDLDPALGIDPPTVTVRQDSFGTASVAARLAIDLSGELRKALTASQAAYRAEQAREWATRLDAETAVATAYFRHLEAIRLLEVGEAAVALYERQLADASAQSEQGRITRNGVLVVEVALSNARVEVRRLANAVDATRRALSRVVGLEVDAAVEVRDVAGRPSLPDLSVSVSAASAANPLVTAMLEEVQAADARLSSVRRSRLPRVAGSAGYDATTADILQPNDYASAGIGFEFDLYDPRREGQVATLEAATRRTRALLDATARDVEAAVRDSHDALAERLAAIDAATVAVGQAEENVRIRRVQFDEGRATSEDLLDASQLLTRQRAQAALALYQAHTRRAELQQLVGAPLAAVAADAGAASPAAAAGASPEIPEGDPR